MKHDHIIISEECQSITTIVWSGDYPAAQQLTRYLVERVESGVFTRTRMGCFTDEAGERMYLRVGCHDLQAAKFWFGDKVVLRNYHPNGNARNLTKDVLALTARMLQPIFADRDAAAKKAESEAYKARVERLNLDIKQLLPASGESISFIDFASALIAGHGHDVAIDSVEYAGIVLRSYFPSSGITDINCHPGPDAMSAIAGCKVTFDRASGMLWGDL